VSPKEFVCNGIFDGMRAAFPTAAYVEQALPAGLNIIARYVERMLSSSQGVHQD